MQRNDNGCKSSRVKKTVNSFVLCIFAGIFLTGCGSAENRPGENAIGNAAEQTEGSVGRQATEEMEEPAGEQTAEGMEGSFGEQAAETEKVSEAAPGLSAEETDAYEQMALYIQEGFRIYGIDEAYQAYFGPIEEEEELFSCDILLEGENDLWSESVSYAMDEENDWYTFSGQHEPLFSGDSFWMLREDDSFVTDLKENYRYKARIAGRTDLSASVHYDSEGGPIERDSQKDIPFHDAGSGYGYYVYPILYTYRDERMDIDIVIEYPEISLPYGADAELEERINEAVRDAFFYGYYSDDRLYPAEKMYTSICRTYQITREDERYFSVRIYEDNYTRGANHPNEWESGVTVDLKTGEVLHLEDVVGKERSVRSLLESGVFESLLSWEGQSTQEWIDEVKMMGGLEEEEPLSEYDSYFYLTEDGLGIITFAGRYYNCLEASFEDLGIEGI